MKRYDDFESFLESSTTDEEFSFSGVFEGIDDAVRTTSILMNADPRRHLIVVSSNKKEEKKILERIFFDTYLKMDEMAERVASGGIDRAEFQDIALIDDRTGYLVGDRLKFLECLMTMARHQKVVIIVVIANGDYETFALKNAFHLHVYKKNEKSYIDSAHKHFIVDGAETWKKKK